MCVVGAELLRPVLRALRAQLSGYVDVIEDELSGAAARAKRQRQLLAAGAEIGGGVASLASGLGSTIQAVKSGDLERLAGRGQGLLASGLAAAGTGLAAVQQVARPLHHQRDGEEEGEAPTDAEVNTVASKHLLSLGCVSHTDYAALAGCGGERPGG